jgi:hypothetical protein
MIENFDSIERVFNFITLISVGLGSFGTWLFMARLNKKKSVSEAKKDIKVNDVTGDIALVEHFDMLYKKFTVMSDGMMKMQQLIAELSDSVYSHNRAHKRIRHLAQEILGREADSFIIEMDKILEELNLIKKEEDENRAD